MIIEKKQYEKAELEIILLVKADFLVTSELTVSDNSTDDNWEKLFFFDLQ